MAATKTQMCLILFSALWMGAQSYCLYEGAIVPPGPVNRNNPCMSCFCGESGEVACAVIKCFPKLICTNGKVAVRLPGKCCPECVPATAPVYFTLNYGY